MINVLYEWNGSPVKDYTLSIYSAMQNFIKFENFIVPNSKKISFKWVQKTRY